MTYSIVAQDAAWPLLPAAAVGQGTPLPVWARMLVRELPLTTASLLQLEAAQRHRSPVNPGLRAAMRWVAAQANGSPYSAACALLDARQAGVDEARLAGLQQAGYPGWAAPDQSALDFARQMTVDSDAVTDAHFATLVEHFGDRQAASMVLLLAYSNFQDRLLICLGPEVATDTASLMPEITFPAESFVIPAMAPSATQSAMLLEPSRTYPQAVEPDPEWTQSTYADWQDRLEQQRQAPTRLRVPDWDEVARNLPPGLISRPSDIIWYRIVFGYAPELAVPFEFFMRTIVAEASNRWDRIFGSSLFWVVTRAIKCPYCMGHCEMNWEVSGLSAAEIAERSQVLAGDDWSQFSPEQQRAFAFAQKLTYTPASVTTADIATLQTDFGPEKALVILMNAARYHYMTRISNGFQLTLERENVFFAYYNMTPPQSAAGR